MHQIEHDVATLVKIYSFFSNMHSNGVTQETGINDNDKYINNTPLQKKRASNEF